MIAAVEKLRDVELLMYAKVKEIEATDEEARMQWCEVKLQELFGFERGRGYASSSSCTFHEALGVVRPEGVSAFYAGSQRRTDAIRDWS